MRVGTLNLPAIEQGRRCPLARAIRPQGARKDQAGHRPRDWSALYQQRPSPETGDFLRREWLRTVQESA
jgi:hypothetical protein